MNRALLAMFLVLTPISVAYADDDVDVLALTCTFTAVGPEVQGQIKNTSGAPITHVELIATFLDKNEKFVSSSDQILADFNPILPGQTSNFDGFGDSNAAITNMTVVPAISYGPSLSNSGINAANCVSGQQ